MVRCWLRLLPLLFVLPVLLPVPAAAIAFGLTKGLQGEYYTSTDFTAYALTRIDQGVNFDWPAGKGPVEGVPAGKFSVEWRGYIRPKFAESYTFTVATNGGVRLWVNGKLLVEKWQPHAMAEDAGTVDLPADKLATVKLDFYCDSPAGIKLLWASKSQAKEVIPPVQLATPFFDDEKIVYTDTPDPRKSAIYLLLPGHAPQQISKAGESEPVLSPNGKKVAFTTTRNVDWKDPKIKVKNTDIYLMDADGSHDRWLTKMPSEDKSPCFSADGKKVAYASNELNKGWAIWLMYADGSRPVKVTQNAFDNLNPCPSPDGKQIVFQSKRDGKWNIFLINSNGSEETQLTTEGGTEPMFSLSGSKIVFLSERDGVPQVYMMGADGANQTRLTFSGLAEDHPVFTVDEREVAYTEKDAQGGSDLYLLQMGVFPPFQLTTSGHCYHPAFGSGEYTVPAIGLECWLSALRTSSIVFDENKRVSSWEDLSGKGRSATQDNPGARPEYRLDAMNGQPGLYFDGGAGCMNLPDMSQGWPGDSGTLIILFSPDNTDHYCVLHQNNIDSDEWWRYNGNGCGYLSPLRSRRTEQNPDTMPTNGPILMSFVSTPDSYLIYKDGIVQPDPGAGFRAPAGMVLGGGSSGGPLHGAIAEVLIFSRGLASGERERIEAMIRGRYGLK